MAKTYREVLERWDRARAFGEQRSLPEYAQHLNDLYGTEDYSAGLNDGWWTRASNRADQFLENTVGQVTEPLLGAVGDVVGYGDVGRQIGRSLPRSLVDMAPLLLGGPVGAVATGVAMGGHTFADTGSSKAAAISGLGGAVMPLGAKLGAAGAEALGLGKLGQYLGSQAGALVPNTAAAVGEQKVLNPNEPFNWKDFSAETLLSQIPFTVFDAVKALSPKPVRTVEQVQPKVEQKYTPPPWSQQEAATVEKLFQDLDSVARDENATPEQKSTALARVIAAVNQPKATEQVRQEAVAPVIAQPEVTITGRASKSGDNYRVLVDNAQSAAALNVKPGDTVWVNSTEPEFDLQTGRFVFKGQANQVKPAKYRLRPEDFGVVPQADPNQPELPVAPEPKPITPEEIQAEADRIGVKLDEAQRILEAKQRASKFNSADIAGVQEMGVDPVALWDLQKDPKTDPAFKDWFGQSKVVDEAGSPLTVHHGSFSKFEQFDPEFLGSNTGASSAFEGFFFASNPSVAESYITEHNRVGRALNKAVERLDTQVEQRGLHDHLQRKIYGKRTDAPPLRDLTPEEANLVDRATRARRLQEEHNFDPYGVSSAPSKYGTRYDVNLKIENPLVVDGSETDFTGYTDLIKQAKAEGHDGVIIKNTYDPGQEFAAGETDLYIVFDPSQIKRTENRQQAIADIKDAVAEFEQAKIQEQDARQKVVANPTNAEDWVGLVPQEKQPELTQKIESGATPTQAVEQARLSTQTKEVADALITQKAAKKKVRDKSPAFRAKELEDGNAIIELYTQAEATDPESSLAPFGQSIRNALQSGDKADPKFTERIARAVARWQAGEYGEPTLDKLNSVLNSVKLRAQGTPSKSIESYKGPTGKRIWGTEAEVQKYIEDNGLAEQGYKPQLPDKATQERRGEKKYFVGKRLFAPGEVALDKPVGEGEAKVGDVLKNQNTLGDAVQESAPKPVIEDVVNQIDRVLKDPQDYVNDLVNDEASNEQVLDVVEELNQVREFLALRDEKGIATSGFLAELNKRLTDKGLSKVFDMTEMRDKAKNVISSVLRYDRTFRNFDLGSQIPFDRTLAEQTGLYDGPLALLKWASQQDLGPATNLLKSYLKLPQEFTGLGIVLPGDLRYNPRYGSHYYADPTNPHIQFSKLPASPEDFRAFAQTIGHEMTHHLTRKLATRTDAAAVQFRDTLDEILDNVRQSADLPPNVRKLLQTALKENHLGKYQKGEIDLKAEWSKHLDAKNLAEWRRIVYGLLNRDELVSNLFDSPQLVALLKETKIAKPKGFIRTALDWLSDAWNTLWKGKPEDSNALAQLLQGYDNYLTGGLLKDVYNGADYIRTQLLNQGVRPEALASRMETVERTFTRGDLRPTVTGFGREQLSGTLPVTTSPGQVNRPLRDALISGDPKAVAQGTMNLLAHEVPLAQDLWYRMKQDVDMATELHRAIKAGEIEGSIPPGAEANLSASRVKLNAMRLALRKQQNALQRLANLDAMDPAGWGRQVADGLSGEAVHRNLPDDFPEAAQVRALTGLERLKGGGMSWLAKTFGLTQFVKEQYPAAKPVVNGVADEQARAHSRAAGLNGAFVFNPEMGSLDPEIKKTYDHVLKSEKLTEAYSDLQRWIQKEGKSQGLNTNDPFVRNVLSRFNEKDRAALMQVITSEGQRYTVWTNKILPQEFNRLNQEDTAMLVAARETGMLPETAREWTSELYDALGMLRDPQQMQIGLEKLRQIGSQVQGDTLTKAMQHAQVLSSKLEEKLAEMRKKPAWVTEQRYEDRLYMSGPKGERFVVGGDRAKLEKIQQEKAKEGYTFLDYVKKEDAANPRYGMREDFLRTIEELDAQNEQMVAQLLADKPDIAAQVVPRLQRAGDLRASLAAGQPLPSVRRRFVGGREYINMLDNANQYYVRMNNYLRNRITRSRSALDMLHPDVQGNTELKQYLQQHVDNFLTPDNPVARKFVEATYFWKLGFDLGNAFLEGTQNLTTGMTSLIRETNSVGDAFALWKNAIGELTRWKATKKWSNPEHERLMDVAAEYGKEGLATWADIADQDVHTVLDAGAKGPLGVMKNGMRKWSTGMVRMNNRIGLLSGYDLARAKGMSPDESIAFAFDMVDKGYFTGGKSQRPVGLWSVQTKAVPQLLSALQTYTLGWFSQMADNYVRGFSRNAPKGLTETQRSGARKAFLYSLAAQAVLAGGLGLPGVGQGIALLQQTTGVDLKGWLRQNLSKLFNEDQDMGGIMTSLALRGAGSAGLPFDPSSRAAVSVPFTGVSAYDGFNVSNLGGAVTSTIGDYVDGLLGLLKGDSAAATKMLPNVAKRPAELLRGEGDIRDNRGGLLYQLSPAERFMMAIGVSPSRVQTAKDANDALRKIQRKQAADREQLVDNLATLYRKGSALEVQKAMIQLKQEQPDTDLRQLARAIAARVEAQTVPFDWRREVNVGADLAGLNERSPSTEAARRNVKSSVQTDLGVQVRQNPRADAESIMMDQLLDSNPTMSRAEARAKVAAILRAGHRNTPLNIPGLQ